MDPNATLTEIRQLYAEMQLLEDAPDDPPTDEARYARHAELSARLRELIEALDQWIMRGGFLPAAWRLVQHVHQGAHQANPQGDQEPRRYWAAVNESEAYCRAAVTLYTSEIEAWQMLALAEENNQEIEPTEEEIAARKEWTAQEWAEYVGSLDTDGDLLHVEEVTIP